MPIVVTMEFPTVSPELYVRTHTDLMRDGRPDGMIAHCCAEKDGGISIVDIWESREQFEAFVDTRVKDVIERYQVKGGSENLTITELVNADAFQYRGSVLSD